MVDSATFLESVGGDGSTVTGDANPTTGLANGGHRKHFVPALAQVVAVASNTVNQALLAKDYAEKTGATVETGTYSAKEYAQGSLTVSGGSAKSWAIKTDGAVSGGEFSAKHHALAAANSATAAAASLTETEGYAEIVMSVANIDFANFEIVDGELLTTYVDSATSTPSIVDGEFVITY